MKILLAAGCLGDPNQGVGGVMHCLAQEYRSAGHEVRFAFRERPGRLAEAAFGFGLALCHGARWADIVDVHAVDAWPLCILPRRPAVVARSHGLELVVHRALLEDRRNGSATISLPYWFYRGSLRLWCERQSLRHSDAAILLNEGDRAIALEASGGDPRRIQCHPNGFPGQFLDHPIGEGRGLAFIGSWLPRKGNDIAAEVIARLLRERPDMPDVLVAGTGQPEGIVLEQFPVEVRSRVRVLERFDRAELPRLLKDVGVLLFPSRSEGSPLALAEAMACGIAPVASRIPGVLDMIDTPRAGRLVDLEAGSAGFVDAIASILDDPVSLDDLRRGARERIHACSWKSVAQAQLSLYATILRSRDGSR